MQRDRVTAVCCAYLRKVYSAAHCILDMTSFRRAHSLRRASMHVDATTG